MSVNINRLFTKLYRAWRLLISLLHHLTRAEYDAVFYASSAIDEVWIRTTLLKCTKQGLRCALFFGDDKTENPTMPVYKGLTVERIHPRILPFIKCKIFITASSGLPRNCMPRNAYQRIHMPHSLVSLHMAYPRGTFDGYDIIFACGEHHLQEVAKISALNNVSVRAVPIGYGKSDLLDSDGGNDQSLQRLLPNSREVLIAPSWGEKNILELLGEELIRALLDRGFRVTVRPHPMFFIKSHSNLVAVLQRKFELNTNFSIDNPQNGCEALFRADIMISDYSGVAMEYAFSRLRPVLFVEVPIKELNQQWREIDIIPIELALREKIGVLAQPRLDSILDALDRIVNSSEKYSTEISMLRPQFVFNYGNTGPKAAQQIIAFAKEQVGDI